MTFKSREEIVKDDSNLNEINFTIAFPQIIAVLVKNILLIGFGMTLGIPTVLIPNFSKSNLNGSFLLSPEEISWIGSLNLICVPIGCLLSGAITTKIGRKKTMQFVNIPFLISWLLFYYSQQVWHIYLALSLTGLAGGLLEAPVLTYVAEITQPQLRGLLSATSTFAIIAGILVEFLLATVLSWRFVALVSCIVPILSFFLLFLIPESPYWLITKNRMQEAQDSLAWLRGWTTKENIQTEFGDFCKAAEISNEHQLSMKQKLEYFKKKNFLWPFALVSFIFFVTHFSGVTTLQTYAVKIFISFNSPMNPYNATVILGVAELIGCVICVVCIRFFGKRILTFSSLIGNFICQLIVGLYAYNYKITLFNSTIDQSINNDVPINNNLNESVIIKEYTWIPTTFLILSAFLTHTGIRILPWILTGEVYSKETRATASGLSSAVGYIFGFVTNKLFLLMISKFTLSGTFWFYSCFSLVSCIILYFSLPETEGKKLYEITNHFAGILKLDNKVYKKSEISLSGEINQGYIENEISRLESKL